MEALVWDLSTRISSHCMIFALYGRFVLHRMDLVAAMISLSFKGSLCLHVCHEQIDPGFSIVW